MSGKTSLTVPVAAGAAPTANGDVRFDSTQKSMVAGGNGSVTGHIPRVLKVTTCTGEANCTGGNQVDANIGQQGATEANFASNYALPANFLFKDKAVRVCASFEVTATTNSPTLHIRFKAGSTNLYTMASQSAPVATGGFGACWMVVGTAAPGAAVAVETGQMPNPMAISSTFANVRNSVSQTVNLATNGSLTLQISAQWSTATNGNRVSLRILTVEELN